MSPASSGPFCVTVKYFAVVREALKRDEETITLEGPVTVQAFMDSLAAREPVIARHRGALRVAVNLEFVRATDVISGAGEIALIPPVAGGSGALLCTTEPLRLEAVIAAVAHAGAGGIVTFTGTVRDHSQGHAVLRLEYEAYPEMVIAEFERIVAGIAAAWPGVRVAIHHRYGRLGIGDAAVVIAASAPHRKQAFLACEAAIDRLKESAPIWKKEFGPEGAVWVGMGP